MATAKPTATAQNVENVKKPTRKAALALASYSMKGVREGDSVYIQTDSEMNTKPKMNKEGTEQMKDDDGKPVNITTVMVTDVITGEQGEMVVPFIVKKAFETIVNRDKTLAGHKFELVKGKKINRTNEWSVYEIE